MSWVKLDDQFPNHPKISQVGYQAGWLYVCGLCYCAQYLTDGRIPKKQVPRLSETRNPHKLALELVSVDLWSDEGNCYQVHDYLDYNPTAESVKKDRETGKRRAAESYQSRKGKGGSSGSLRAKNGDSSPDPSPSRSPLSSSSPPRDAPAARADQPDEDPTEQILTATFDRLARFDLDQARAEGQTIRNPTAWLTAATTNRAAAHDAEARAELARGIGGKYYPPHVELAEHLDDRCGPDDGGNHRADMRRAETRLRLAPDEGAA